VAMSFVLDSSIGMGNLDLPPELIFMSGQKF
jgi:hypothetical protein